MSVFQSDVDNKFYFMEEDAEGEVCQFGPYETEDAANADLAKQQIENEKFCYYCGEPLDDGLCSASCHESEDDEGRECECEDREEE